jgi:dipeptidyl aminopeptidase/acylaminoacyl peptidase
MTADPRLHVDELIALGRVGELRASPDHSWLAVVVQRLSIKGDKYVSDLWRVPTDGGPAVQLTRGDHRDSTPRFRADGTLGFLSDRKVKPDDADSRAQVWLLPPTGEPYPITDEPLGVLDFDFTGECDATDLVMLAEVLPGVEVDAMREAAKDRADHGPSALHYPRGVVLRHWQEWTPATAVHLITRRDGVRADLTPDAGHQLRSSLSDNLLAVAPSGREVAVLWTTRGEHRIPVSVIRRYDLASGAHVEHGAAAMTSYAGPCWTPDGAAIVALRSTVRIDGGAIDRLWRFDARAAATADAARIGAAVAPDWDAYPTLHGVTADGELIATADVEGATPVFLVSKLGEPRRVIGDGVHDQVRPLGAKLAVVRSTSLHPAEPFLVDASDGTLAPLAPLSGFPAGRGAELAEVETRWIDVAGGERVQYLVVKPRGVTRPPVLFWIHGGPVAQWADGWHWRWNTLLAACAGYAVVLPNPRGSTGRGQPFVDGVYNNSWGGACYADLMAVADAVAARPDLDGAHPIAMGGSFGGYMVNWIGGQTDRFAAIISHAGIFALREFHGTTDYPGYFALEMGGPPWATGADYARYSPDAFVTRWKTPTLIIHGEKDYRCPIGEALLLYEALDAHGVDVELLAFPDEGHWITRPRNITTWYRTWLGFAARYSRQAP